MVDFNFKSHSDYCNCDVNVAVISEYKLVCTVLQSVIDPNRSALLFLPLSSQKPSHYSQRQASAALSDLIIQVGIQETFWGPDLKRADWIMKDSP